MLLPRVMTWELKTGRSHRKTAHFSPHLQTAPFPFPLFLVFIPTCVASAATKPYLESKSRDKVVSRVCLIMNQSVRPSSGFSKPDRCNC